MVASTADGPKRARMGAKVKRIAAILDRLYPDVSTPFAKSTPFELLVATVLSAQTTDVNVNKATPKIFAKYPDAITRCSTSSP